MNENVLRLLDRVENLLRNLDAGGVKIKATASYGYGVKDGTELHLNGLREAAAAVRRDADAAENG